MGKKKAGKKHKKENDSTRKKRQAAKLEAAKIVLREKAWKKKYQKISDKYEELEEKYNDLKRKLKKARKAAEKPKKTAKKGKPKRETQAKKKKTTSKKKKKDAPKSAKIRSLKPEQKPVATPVRKRAAPRKSEVEVLALIRENARSFDFSRIGKATSDEMDDLTRIKGIGPFLQNRLNVMGIFTYEQLSKLTPDDEVELTRAIRYFPGRIQRDEWAKQAKSLLGGN